MMIEKYKKDPLFYDYANTIFLLMGKPQYEIRSSIRLVGELKDQDPLIQGFWGLVAQTLIEHMSNIELNAAKTGVVPNALETTRLEIVT